jgi:HK97 family phage major capsid protein
MGTTPEVRAVLNTGTDTDGGFVVPARLMGTVLGALVPQSSLLSLGAGILPLEGDGQGAKSFTMAAVDTIPSAAWRSENGAVAESSPGFRGVVMAPKSLSFYFKVSREWLADAVGIDSVLTMAIAQAFAKELDRAGLRGSGTAPEPRGILNTSGILAVSSGANGATSAVAKYFNLTAGVQSIMEANGPMPNGAIMTPRSLVGFANQTDTTGQSLTRLQLLDGITFKTTTQIPNNLTVGTSTDCSEIYLGDFSKLVFAMREQMSIQLLKETFATSGQVAFLCHVRADVAVLYPKAFAVITGVRP